MRLRGRLDSAAVERGLEAMARAAGQLGPAWRQLKRDMRADQVDHAREQAGPTGKWPARAASTVAKTTARSRKSGKRRRARRPLGKLPHSTQYTATGTGVRGRSRVPWSGVHQEGDRVGRGSVIPARPFLWISDDLLVTAVTRLERFVLNAYGGR